MANEIIINQDPSTGITRKAVWNTHDPHNGWVVMDTDKRILNAIFERNKKLYEASRVKRGTEDDGAGAIAEMPLEDYYRITMIEHPDYQHMKGIDKKDFWKKVLKRPENKHLCVNRPFIERTR